MRFNRRMRAFPLLMVVLLLVSAWQVPTARGAQQLVGPVGAEFTVIQEGKDGLVALVNLTASEWMEGTVLEVRAPEGVKVEPQKVELPRLGPQNPIQVKVWMMAEKDGDYQLDFVVSGQAKGYERAGIGAQRYLSVRDGKSQFMTGFQLRRQFRTEVARKLENDRKRDPDKGVTLDTYLAGQVRPLPEPDQTRNSTGAGLPGVNRGIDLTRGLDLNLDLNREIKLTSPNENMPERPKGALAPPARGLESYDGIGIIDKSADVIRQLDPITVTGQIYYVGRDGLQYPFVNASIDIMDDDVGPDEYLTTVGTDWDGRFTAVVNGDDGWFQDGRDIYLRIRSTNTRFRVQDCSYWPDWTYTWETGVRNSISDGTVANFGGMVLVGYQEASVVFQDLNQGWNYLTAVGGQDPGFVDLCYPGDGSYYDYSEVFIETGDWVARDVVLHEYGHATMHNAYDGYWPPNSGGPHTFNSILHRNMAFTEGWGTFIALTINDDGVYDSNGWSRSIENFSHWSAHTDGDGKVNEGHVAAGLGDIRDGNADGDDPSGPDASPFPTIWRDAFWLSKADDVDEFWDTLCIELSPDQRTAAIKALAFNEIDVPDCSCSAEVAFAGEEDGQESLKALREFRDMELRGTDFGVRIAQLYYKHSTEVGTIMLQDKELRKMGQQLFREAVKAHRILKEGGKDDILLDAKHAALARDFLDRVQERGSKSIRGDFEMVKLLVNGFEGRRASEVREKIQFLNQKP